MLRFRRLCLAFAFSLLPIAGLSADEPPLGVYNADIRQTSISGISSGAFMAVQFAVAWSSIVVGVGAIAGGPFGCAEGSASAALSTCMLGAPALDLATLIRRTDAWSEAGKIDDTANLKRQRVYLFNGYNDAVVARNVSDALQAFYIHYRPASLFYQTAIGAGHGQVTLDYGGKCAANGDAFINRCGYDQAGIILQHSYGVLRARNPDALRGQLITFEQPKGAGLNDKGFAFIPAACAAREPCRVHVALHGCRQSFTDIGEAFVRHAGYNEWAGGNHIIVLYPQTRASALANPQSCWDWWGYLDADPMGSPSYLLKAGRQISAIKAMLDRITSGFTESSLPDATPLQLRTLDASDTAIDLAWTARSRTTRYQVLRADPGNADFKEIATVSSLSFGDAGLRPGTAYRYKVRAQPTGEMSPIVQMRTRPKVARCLEPGTCAVR